MVTIRAPRTHGFDLLTVLDGLVCKAPGPSGLSGRICFGVLTEKRATRWLLVDFDERPQTRWFDVLPETLQVDLLVFLGEEEARSVLLCGTLPPNTDAILVQGDRGLLKRFKDRYLKKLDPLGLRMSQLQRTNRSRKRRRSPRKAHDPIAR